MATYKKGILGVFTGKVGTVVGSSWKGISYMKSLPKSSGKAPTPLQLDQRLKFALVGNFLKPIKSLTNIGYGSVTGNVTPANAVASYHLNNAVIGNSPNFQIDYPMVMFSRGELPGPAVPAMIAAPSGALNFSWVDNATANLAQPNDKAIVLVFNVTTKEFVHDATAERSGGSLEMILPAHFVGNTVHAWMAFFDVNDKQVSTSVYLGEETVT